MRIIIFQGGLGNQIFQYLFYEYIRKKVGGIVLGVVRDGNNHNGFEIDKYFDVDIKMPIWLYKCFKIFENYRWKYPQYLTPFYINEDSLSGRWGFIYDGYWQDRKYMTLVDVHFKDLPLSDRNAEIKRQMLGTNSVALHVRRGDYLIPPHNKLFANICTIEYYNQAVYICRRMQPNSTFFVFSDDIEWARQNLSLEDCHYIDWNNGDDSIFDMYLMSQAKMNIIANSTFSFWGAYLNKNSPLVVYPKKWFNDDCGVKVPDIFPNTWIGI